jgi:hypothetical protein
MREGGLDMVMNRLILMGVLLLTWGGLARAADGLMLIRPAELGGAVERMVSVEELQALPQVTINTETEFTDGIAAFAGPLARDVVALIGQGTGTRVRLTAVNDYAIEIELKDFDDYDVIFALSMNGSLFSPRDRGPVWVMYPLSDHEELQDPAVNAKLIWQLVKLEVM